MGKSVLPDASFANLSANSFPLVPAWAFTYQNRIFHSLVSISCTVCFISSVRNVQKLNHNQKYNLTRPNKKNKERKIEKRNKKHHRTNQSPKPRIKT